MYEENERPIARPEYPRWYFDAVPSDWSSDGMRGECFSLSPAQPDAEAAATYSAEAEPEHAPAGRSSFRVDGESAPAHPRATGLAFISGPVSEDLILAGYGRVKLWVSSSGEDVDIQVVLHITDKLDGEADFSGPVTMGFPARNYPLAKGRLRASRREPDASAGAGIVAVEIALIPVTTLVRRGQRIRIDVQPHDGQGQLAQHAYDPGHRTGATNTVHTGPAHLGYVQLPLNPAQFDR